MKVTNMKTLKHLGRAGAMVLLIAGAQAIALQHAAAASWQNNDDPVLDGVRLFRQGDYSAAMDAFQQAVQNKPTDTLAKVWFGLAKVASGDTHLGIVALKDATDTVGDWSGEAAELRALSYWRQGNTDNAKSELGFCMWGKTEDLCKKMKRGIESGEEPPDISTWPKLVGILGATKARGTTWSPE